MGSSSRIAFIAFYPTQICCCVEMAEHAALTKKMTLSWVLVQLSQMWLLWERPPSLRQVPHTIAGGVPAEPTKGIDRYLNKAGRQNCLSMKDGSL